MRSRPCAAGLMCLLFVGGCRTVDPPSPASTMLYPGGDAAPVRFAASYLFFVPAVRRNGEAADAAIARLEAWLASQQTGFTRWQAEGASGDGRPPRRGWFYRVSVRTGAGVDAAGLRSHFVEAFGPDEPFYLVQ